MAVKPPTCRICNVAHWSVEGHQFPKDSKPSKSETVAKVREQVAAIVPKPAVDQDRFDRKAYQKDYMKAYMAKRRAKA